MLARAGNQNSHRFSLLFLVIHWRSGVRLRTDRMTHRFVTGALSSASCCLAVFGSYTQHLHTHTYTHSARHAHALAHIQISRISFLMTFIDFCCCFVRFHFFFPDLWYKKHTHTNSVPDDLPFFFRSLLYTTIHWASDHCFELIVFLAYICICR